MQEKLQAFWGQADSVLRGKKVLYGQEGLGKRETWENLREAPLGNELLLLRNVPAVANGAPNRVQSCWSGNWPRAACALPLAQPQECCQRLAADGMVSVKSFGAIAAGFLLPFQRFLLPTQV